MAIKWLVSDLDGTLLTHDRRPHPLAKQAIHRALDAGITVILASGRAIQSIDIFAKELEVRGPVIASNGVVVLSESREVIRAAKIPQEAAQIAYEYCLGNGLQLTAYTPEGPRYLQPTQWGALYASRVNIPVVEMPDWESFSALHHYKLMVTDDPNNISRHRSVLEPMMKNLPVCVTESEPEYLEFLPLNADKGTGLQILADNYGVRREEIAAVGDYLNDLTMLEWCGLSGAVANAHPTVKNIAKVMVASNDDGGFAEFVNRFVLQP